MRKTEASKFRPLAQVLPYSQERVSKDMAEALLEAALLTLYHQCKALLNRPSFFPEREREREKIWICCRESCDSWQ